MEFILDMVLPLLCGLALFLFGMDFMGDSLKKIASRSKRIKKSKKRWTPRTIA